MAFDPVASVPLGRTGLTVTRLGFGSASIGVLNRWFAGRTGQPLIVGPTAASHVVSVTRT